LVYKYTSLTIRIIFAVVFTLSAYTKLVDIQAFAQSMNSYAILPKSLVPIFTYYVPIMEFGLALGFVISTFAGVTAVVTAVVVVVFQIALASLIVRGIEIDCGCFGRFATTPKAALIRNFIILFLDSLLLLSLYKNIKLQNRNGDYSNL